MQIPILSGVYVDSASDFRVAYPRNLVPVALVNGISEGYLRPADGITTFAEGPGVDRGGINWKGVCYRVMDSKLISVDEDGVINEIGVVGGNTDQVTFDYSFDRLAIASDNKLYYYDLALLTQVTDPDLGNVKDVVWVDGYFMTTDGTSLVVTELTDPFSVNPLKYGSAETDPDQVQGLFKLRNEVYAVGRYTIEVFENVGGDLFPFQRIPGAQIQRGAVGTNAACSLPLGAYVGVAFLGGARNEPASIWFGINGTASKLATREVDSILQSYSEQDIINAVLETRIDKGSITLYVHLPDQTLAYDSSTSDIAKQPVWYILTSSIDGIGTYRARNMVWCYNKWIVGDVTTQKLGVFTPGISSHYGDENGWEVSTQIMYNEGNGIIIHELELVSITGNVSIGDNPTVWTSYSLDGVTWSQERPKRTGVQGNRSARINWLQQGSMLHCRMQKFRGTSKSHMSIARLEARIEPLGV